MSSIQIIAISYVVLICIGLPFVIKAHKKSRNIVYDVLIIFLCLWSYYKIAVRQPI